MTASSRYHHRRFTPPSYHRPSVEYGWSGTNAVVLRLSMQGALSEPSQETNMRRKPMHFVLPIAALMLTFSAVAWAVVVQMDVTPASVKQDPKQFSVES